MYSWCRLQSYTSHFLVAQAGVRITFCCGYRGEIRPGHTVPAGPGEMGQMLTVEGKK
jgi:hypothetical protein